MTKLVQVQKKMQAEPSLPSASEDEEDLDMENDDEEEEEQASDEVASSGKEDEADDDQPRKKLKTVQPAYQEPTANELYDLKNTENLYHSNLLRLQLNELLSELSLSDDDQRRATKLTETLIKDLTSLESISDIKFKNYRVFDRHPTNQQIKVPLVELCSSMEGVYSFLKPQSVFLVGSFSHATSAKLDAKYPIQIDLCVEMPAGYFNERDYLNYRYFLKKCLYMGHVLLQLTDKRRSTPPNAGLNYSDTFEFEFQSELGRAFNPNLVLSTKNDNIQIVVRFVPEDGSFKLNRFNALQNNVRRDWHLTHVQKPNSFLKLAKYDVGRASGDKSSESDDSLPTASYNNEILADLRLKANNQLISEHIKKDHKNIHDAIKLLKLWLHKRDLLKGFGSMNGFVLTMLICDLLQRKQINALMSSYQIFRLVLISFNDGAWNKRPLLMNSGSGPSEKVDYKGRVAFVDPSGLLNLCAKLSNLTYSRIKYEAAQSLKLLSDELNQIDKFDYLFLKPSQLHLTFDALFEIDTSLSKMSGYCEKIFKADKNFGEKLLDFYYQFSGVFLLVLDQIESYLSRALGKHARVVFRKLDNNIKWSVGSKVPETEANSVTFGVIFGDDFENVLIKGPVDTDRQAAQEFQKFWGGKAELRRFQDSSIHETALFELTEDTISHKRLVYSSIVKYILNLHFDIKDGDVKFLDRQMNSLLAVPSGVLTSPSDVKTILPYGTGEERLASIVHTYDELMRLIRNLKDLPLSITNLTSISSAMRYTDVFAQLPCNFKYDKTVEKTFRTKASSGSMNYYLPKYPLGQVIAPYVQVFDIACQLEASGKWPNDLEAIKRLKTAFYIKIAQLMRQSADVNAAATHDYCEIFFKGFVFRLFIFTFVELVSMRTEMDEQFTLVTKLTDDAFNFEKRLLQVPKLTSALFGVQQKYACYSSVTRLAKRWLASNLILDYFGEEAVDLICAYIFMNQAQPYDVPRSLITGFARFVDFVANFDWKNQFILIDFNNEFKKEQIVAMQLKFQETRSSFPPVFILTSLDIPLVNNYLNGVLPTQNVLQGNKFQSFWTSDEKPSLSSLCRLVMLAKESVPKLKTCALEFKSPESFKNLFRPNESIYDLVINLKSNYCVNAYRSVDIAPGTFLPHYRDYSPSDHDKTLPIADFDPVKCYVDQLRSKYKPDVASFEYDAYGATKVFVLLKPKALESLNAILDDFKLQGHELVDSVTISPRLESKLLK